MPTVVLSPIGGAGEQFLDNNGNVLSGGKIYTYAAGTTTPLTTYTSLAGTVANPNPVVLNSAGRVSGQIWLIYGASYKFVIKDSLGNTIDTQDNISGSSAAGGLVTAATIVALKAMTGMTTGTRVLVQDIGFFRYDSTSSTTAVGSLVVTPDAGVGRWFLEVDGEEWRPYFNVKQYGAVGDGLTNDTVAIQAAADAALLVNGTLLIPQGTFYVPTGVNVYTSVECYGEILTTNANAGSCVTVLSSVASTTIPAAGVTGLTKGSKTLGGVTDLRGATLVLTSTEVLINRDSNPQGETYTKAESSLIVSDAGDISPALDSSYSTAALTVTIKPYEPLITIKGLRIRSTGATSSNAIGVSVQRSHVTLDSCEVFNADDTGTLREGFQVVSAVDVTFIGCQTSGTALSGLGYGVNLSKVANVSLVGCSLHCARHSVSGRNVKSVTIIGGLFSSGIDCHWGRDFAIVGVTCTASSTTSLAHVLYAGSNITISDSSFVGGLQLLGIRNDTPECDGRVQISGCRVYTDEIYFQFLTYSSANQGLGFGSGGTNYTGGHTLLNPSLVTINDCLVEAPSAARVDVLNISGQRLYDQNFWGTVNITNITGVGSEKIVAFAARKNLTYQVSGSKTTVRIRGVSASNDTTYYLVNVRDDSTTPDTTKGFEVYLRDCRDIGLVMDAKALMVGEVRDCRFSSSSNLSKASSQDPTGYGGWAFSSCKFVSSAFNIDSSVVFVGCDFAGTITQSSAYWASLDVQTSTSVINTITSGATGYPRLHDVVGPRSQVLFGTTTGQGALTGMTTGSWSGWGAKFDGTNWIATQTTAALTRNGDDEIAFYLDSALVVGNTFTPTKVASFRNGRMAVGTQQPTAHLHLRAGGTGASAAPLKFTSSGGGVLATPEVGAVEFTNAGWWGTPTGTTRERFFTGPSLVSSTVNPGLIAAGAVWESGAIAVTAAAVNDPVLIGPPAAIEAGLVWVAFVSSAGNIKLRIHNTTGGGVTPASATWKFTVLH